MLVAALLDFGTKFSGKCGRISAVVTIDPEANSGMFGLARRLFRRFSRPILQQDNFDRARHGLGRDVHNQFAARSNLAFEFSGENAHNSLCIKYITVRRKQY